MELDIAALGLPTLTRTSCACPMCQVGCHAKPGMLAPHEAQKIHAKVAPDRDFAEWAQEHFTASSGMKLMVGDVVWTIPTVVPAKRGGACVFYENARCTIHEVSPYGCRMFDHRQSEAEAEIRVLVFVLMFLANEKAEQAHIEFRDTLPVLSAEEVEKRQKDYREISASVAHVFGISPNESTPEDLKTRERLKNQLRLVLSRRVSQETFRGDRPELIPEMLRRAFEEVQNVVAAIEKSPCDREELERRHGKVRTFEEVEKEFEIDFNGGPLMLVRRRSDGVEGILTAQREPRFYFGFQPLDPAQIDQLGT